MKRINFLFIKIWHWVHKSLLTNQGLYSSIIPFHTLNRISKMTVDLVHLLFNITCKLRYTWNEAVSTTWVYQKSKRMLHSGHQSIIKIDVCKNTINCISFQISYLVNSIIQESEQCQMHHWGKYSSLPFCTCVF